MHRQSGSVLLVITVTLLISSQSRAQFNCGAFGGGCTSPVIQPPCGGAGGGGGGFNPGMIQPNMALNRRIANSLSQSGCSSGGIQPYWMGGAASQQQRQQGARTFIISPNQMPFIGGGGMGGGIGGGFGLGGGGGGGMGGGMGVGGQSAFGNMICQMIPSTSFCNQG
ncbi:unnamed protein product [Anisakis simplex]|uniref:Uncharacterized protein n=1 Tax=Anisakis simplex TaxID=6269 RepID=A0A0M3K2Y4_ANISI|nr:unnamed protein product [Anisakis simplex]